MTHKERAEKFLDDQVDERSGYSYCREAAIEVLKAEFGLVAAKAIADWEKSKWAGFKKLVEEKPTLKPRQGES